jgi:hypothetical protein
VPLALLALPVLSAPLVPLVFQALLVPLALPVLLESLVLLEIVALPVILALPEQQVPRERLEPTVLPNPQHP